MSGQNPSMAVRVAANLDELRRNLAEGKGLIETTTAGMQKLAGSLDGSKLEQRAHNIAAAITQVGGVSKLSEAEARRMLPTLDAWIEKGERLGKKIPDSMYQMRDALVTTRGATTDVLGTFRQFDDVLELGGVRILEQVKGLDQLVAAAGQTGAQMGNLAKAGLLVSAALGGWQIGRWVSGLFDLDEKIGNAAAKLLGFGDVGAQRAAAGADTLARASKLAGFQIHDMGTAMIVLEDAAKATTKANEEFAAAAARGIASEKNATAIAAFNKEVEAFRSSGTLPALTRDLQSNLFTQQELAAAYHLSTAAVAAFAKESDNAARIEESNQTKLAKLRDDWTKAQASASQRQAEADAKKKQALFDEIDAETKAAEAAKAKRDAMLEGETAAKEAVTATTAALQQQVSVMENAADREKRLASERDARNATTFGNFDDPVSASRLLARPARSLDDFVRMYAGYSGGYDFAVQQYQIDQEIRRRAQAVLDAANKAGYVGPGSGNIPGFASGIDNFRGGLALVGERGPELVNLPRGSDVIPNHAIGGTVTVIINGSVLSDEQKIADAVGRALMGKLRSQGMRLPAGA